MTLEDHERSIWFFPFGFNSRFLLKLPSLLLASFKASPSYLTRISISNPLDISLIYFQQEKIWASGRIVCDPICFLGALPIHYLFVCCHIFLSSRFPLSILLLFSSL